MITVAVLLVISTRGLLVLSCSVSVSVPSSIASSRIVTLEHCNGPVGGNVSASELKVKSATAIEESQWTTAKIKDRKLT